MTKIWQKWGIHHNNFTDWCSLSSCDVANTSYQRHWSICPILWHVENDIKLAMLTSPWDTKWLLSESHDIGIKAATNFHHCCECQICDILWLHSVVASKAVLLRRLCNDIFKNYFYLSYTNHMSRNFSVKCKSVQSNPVYILVCEGSTNWARVVQYSSVGVESSGINKLGITIHYEQC